MIDRRRRQCSLEALEKEFQYDLRKHYVFERGWGEGDELYVRSQESGDTFEFVRIQGDQRNGQRAFRLRFRNAYGY